MSEIKSIPNKLSEKSIIHAYISHYQYHSHTFSDRFTNQSIDVRYNQFALFLGFLFSTYRYQGVKMT